MSIGRPRAALSLSGAASPAGLSPAGLGGALDMAQAAVGRLTADLSVDEAHDRAELWLWHGSLLADASPGDVLTIGLTADGDPTDVATVEVYSVDRTHWGAILTGFAPSRRLSECHVGKSYVDQSLADVVADLISQGEVDRGEIDAALHLPSLHIDPRRSVWGNLHQLANRLGFQMSTGADGSLSFTPIPGATGAAGLGGLAGAAAGAAGTLLGAGGNGELREGAELIWFRAGPRPESPTAASVTPAGSSADFILAAEPDDGTDTVHVAFVLRTRDAADQATAAAQARARRATRRSRVRVPGRPDLRPGGTVTARGEPYRILSVRHVLAEGEGFTTELFLEGDQ
jgi:hypothetical protein